VITSKHDSHYKFFHNCFQNVCGNITMNILFMDVTLLIFHFFIRTSWAQIIFGGCFISQTSIQLVCLHR